MSTGETVLVQPRRESTLYRQVSEMGQLVQLRGKVGTQVVLDRVFIEEPWKVIATDAVVLGLSAYIFFSNPYWVMRTIAVAAGLASLVDIVSKLYQIAGEPAVAYQAVNPSLDV